MCVANCSSSLNSLVSWLTMSAMTWVSSMATNFSVFFATGLGGSGSVPNSFCQKLRTCFASETISSTVFLTSMKDVLASLYSLHPCLIAATQALAARRRLSGSIFYSYIMLIEPASKVSVPLTVVMTTRSSVPPRVIEPPVVIVFVPSLLAIVPAAAHALLPSVVKTTSP